MVDRYDTSNLIQNLYEPGSKGTELLSTLIGLQAGLPPLDFSELKGVKRDEYFAAVQSGMDRDYKPMERIFSEVIEWTKFSCER